MGVGNVLLLLALGGGNACFLQIAGNQVTAYLGGVMLQVLGNVKACLSIIISVAIFGNAVQSAQVFGVVVCLSGVALYNWKGGVVTPVVVTECRGAVEVEAPESGEPDQAHLTKS